MKKLILALLYSFTVFAHAASKDCLYKTSQEIMSTPSISILRHKLAQSDEPADYFRLVDVVDKKIEQLALEICKK